MGCHDRFMTPHLSCNGASQSPDLPEALTTAYNPEICLLALLVIYLSFSLPAFQNGSLTTPARLPTP